MKLAWIAATLLMTAGEAANAEADCSPAQELIGRAQSATDAKEAEDLLRRAVDMCPSYEAYEALGELLAQAPYHADRLRAVEAFVSADSLASTAQSRANTRFHYARLLDDDEDPENANTLIQEAQTLDPSSSAIRVLSKRIEDEVRRPSQEHLTRGLWNSMYKPLRIASAKGSEAPAAAPPARPSVTIAIHFETGSVMTDQETISNIAILAHVLADKSHPEQRFIFVGHADARGNEQTNVELSRRRAEAIYQTVVAMEPALSGRIRIEGRGSSEPLNPGHDEHAYQANRRLQVLLD
jgi:outer membrane protein OmpA-like peptidoglycan-associated protein